jgi:hypothetical protein
MHNVYVVLQTTILELVMYFFYFLFRITYYPDIDFPSTPDNR